MKHYSYDKETDTEEVSEELGEPTWGDYMAVILPFVPLVGFAVGLVGFMVWLWLS